ncbi:MAG: PRC-barrel domain-containing protein [Candidatus Diapherotrites archaeon]|nr:PRC-barrel domain-containing protein [Candidatus Diapherotrites archaeon]
MLFRKEIRGKEVIDRDGTTIGVVEDVDIGERGEVTRILVMPKGVMRILARKKDEIKMDDVASISEVIVLRRTLDEIKHGIKPIEKARKPKRKRGKK